MSTLASRFVPMACAALALLFRFSRTSSSHANMQI